MIEDLTLIEMLETIRDLYKSIAFESAVITQNMYGIEWTDKERLTCQDTIKYSLNHIDRLQRQIERGQYREENPYAV